MNKAMFFACFILLLPNSSIAGENMLPDIAENMFILVEATISCAAQEGSCTESDAVALQSNAVNGLWDILGLLRPGKLRSMKLSGDHVEALCSRVEALKSQLVHIGMFETACNFGFALLDNSVFLIKAGFFYLLPVPPMGLMFILLGLLGIPASCLVLLSCLFGWL